jgi:hypothetical protein
MAAKSQTEPVEAEVVNEKPRMSHVRYFGNVWGLIVVAIGVLFLVQAYTGVGLNNWWALIFFLPTFGAWASAYRLYKIDGRFGAGAWGSFVGGLFPAAIGLIFILDLDWSKVWPVFIIISGLAALGPHKSS